MNIAHDLDDEKLQSIGQQVLLGYQEDKNSMEEWLADVKKIEDLATMKSKRKSTPIPNAANVKLPLITKACLEYSSATYPEILPDGKIAKARVVGLDLGGKKEAAQRVMDFINYQLLFKDSVYERSLDKLLNRLPLIGFLCTKTYYDNVCKKIKSVLCKPEELIIPADTESLEDAVRISHILHYRINDLVTQKNKTVNGQSLFLPKPVEELLLTHQHDQLNTKIDGLEQCLYLDLDEDGLLEPYIVTVLLDNGKVLRIAPRYEENDVYADESDEDQVCYITPTDYYEDYHFLPNPNGSFLSVGFGTLLLHLTEASNTVMNQLLDAGQLANMKGGYMDARFKPFADGNSLHDQGEFKLVKVMAGLKLEDGILPIQYGEPSSVLFQLLGLLMEVCRDLTSSAEINNGTQSSENAKTGATLALQAAGKKSVNAINKRVYCSISKFLRHVFILNSRYLDQEEYYNVLDDRKAVKQEDFNLKSVDILPIADPNLASEVQRGQEIQQLAALMQAGLDIDVKKVTTLILSRMSVPGVMEVQNDPNQKQPPNPEFIKIQADIEAKGQELHQKGVELELREKELMIKTHIADADIALKQAQTALAMAQAVALKTTQEIKQGELEFGIVSKHIDTGLALRQLDNDTALAKQGAPNAQEGPGALPEQPGDQGAAPIA